MKSSPICIRALSLTGQDLPAKTFLRRFFYVKSPCLNSGRHRAQPESKRMTASPLPQMTRYRQWLREQRGLNFGDYEELRQWSVRELDAFWQSIWDYFELQSPTPHRAVLSQRRMPGAV
jgi:hypothetical protein